MAWVIDPAHSEIQLSAKHLMISEERRDTHLRSPDFLDVEKYPYLRFKSTRVELLDETHGKLYGDLTIRNITRPVVLDVEYTLPEQTV